MSLSLPERLRVVLDPGEIVLLRPGPPWRRAPREAQRFPCAAQGAQEAWQPPLQRLADVLDAQGAARLRLGFVLSNHFVRYQVVPWRRELVRPAEREALARHGFVRVYGERAAGWRIRLGDGPWGAATLACAVDEALLARIAAFAAGRGLRVESIEPHLVRAFNRFRRRLGSHGALALLEPGRLCLAVFGRGEWTAVHSQRLEAGAAPADALLRLLRSAGLPPQLPVHVGGEPGAVQAVLAGRGAQAGGARPRAAEPGRPRLTALLPPGQGGPAGPAGPVLWYGGL